MKDRFLKEGLDGFDDLHVIELLLFYCIPRKDTNLVAHYLLERFGSLAGLLDATPKELESVPEVGKNIAAYLALLKPVWRRYEVQKANNEMPMQTIAECGDHMRPYFINRTNETVYLLCLDAKGKALCCKMVGEGSVNSASISIRKIVETALNANASSVVLAHNHPSGLAIPSPEDVQTTKRLGKALHAVEITLVDHLVFADGDYVSIGSSGNYSPYQNQDYL